MSRKKHDNGKHQDMTSSDSSDRNEMLPGLTRRQKEHLYPVHDSGVGHATQNKARGKEPSIKDYIRIVQKHRLLIAISSLLIIGVTTAYVFLKSPMYTATTTLKVNFYTPTLPGENAEDTLSQQSRTDEYINTLVQQINSPTIARSVLSNPTIAQKLFRNAKNAPPATQATTRTENTSPQETPTPTDELKIVGQIAGYLSHLTVSTIFKTTLIQIAMTSRDRNLSALMANTHAAAFIDRLRDERKLHTQSKLEFLQQQAEELNAKIEKAEKALVDYAEKNEIVAINEDDTILLKQFAEISRELTQLTSKRLKSEETLREATLGFGGEAASTDLGSLSELRSSLREAEAEYAQLRDKFTSKYPKVAQLKARIQSLREQATQAIKAQYQSELGAEKKLQSQLDQLKKKVFTFSQTQIQYNMMQAEYESLRDLRHTVLKQIDQARLGSENKDINVVISEPAEVPLARSSPRRGFILGVAILISPLLGFAVALLIERLNHTFKNLEEIQEQLGLPALGAVPRYMISTEPSILPQAKFLKWVNNRYRKTSPARLELEKKSPIKRHSLPPAIVQPMILDAPRSSAAEAFRTIRTNILLSVADRTPKIIMITSAKKSEGKSTIVSNLAIAMAQVSKSCIVVESDLRCPRLSTYFKYNPKRQGLVDYLTSDLMLEDVIIGTPLPNLFVLPAGSLPPDPADLISSVKFATLIHTLSQHFEYVLLDSPPILPVADGLALSRLSDGVVVVVESKKTDRDAVKNAVSQLRYVHARILGVIINRTDVSAHHVDMEYGDEYIAPVEATKMTVNG